jgi:DNA-binding MarR family transcriptional regulator
MDQRHPKEADSRIQSKVVSARSIYLQRRLRERIFPLGFVEPDWDMLLELASAAERRDKLSVKSLCLASGVPATTALRYLGKLEEAGLAERCDDPNDARRIFVSLTASGRRMMADYLGALHEAEEGNSALRTSETSDLETQIGQVVRQYLQQREFQP